MGYDTLDFVETCRLQGITPQMARRQRSYLRACYASPRALSPADEPSDGAVLLAQDEGFPKTIQVFHLSAMSP